jgi:RNA polymerase sigma-70 factor (ECF subfamily)
MSDPSDQQLVNAFTAGDKEAFNAIIERYHVRVYRLAYKFTRTKDDAEDIAQDSFLRAYEYLRKHPNKEINLKPWLMTICVNLCRNLAKKKKSFNFSALEREDDDRSFQDSIQDRALTPKEKSIKRETALQVQAAVDNLPEKYQIVIQLRYVDDLSYQEIADTLSIPLNTVKIHLNRAKKHLKTYLDPHG